MSISIFPTPSSETTPIGAGAKVIDGWTGVGSYTTSSLPAGEYVAYSSAPDASSKNFKLNSYIFMNGNNTFASLGNDSSGAHFKNSSSGTMFFSNPYGQEINTRNSAFQDSNFYKFGSTYYAVSQNNNNAATVPWFFTSTDLITWTQVNATGMNTGNMIYGFAYSPGINRIAALVRISSDCQIFTSDNGGANWTARSLVGSTTNALDIEFSGSIFVCNTGASSFPFYSSTDGVTWTSRSNPTSSFEYHSIEWGNNIFVATGRDNSGGNYITSADGITWTGRVHPFGANQVVNRARYLNGRWIMTGQTQGFSATSTDGITWTVGRNFPGSGTIVKGFVNGHYLMNTQIPSGGFTAFYMLGSVDGLNWTTLYSITPSGDPESNIFKVNVDRSKRNYITLGTELYLVNGFGGIIKRIPGYFALYSAETTADLN
jgi:hypothetical protein